MQLCDCNDNYVERAFMEFVSREKAVNNKARKPRYSNANLVPGEIFFLFAGDA